MESLGDGVPPPSSTKLLVLLTVVLALLYGDRIGEYISLQTLSLLAFVGFVLYFSYSRQRKDNK